jgi:hypothetical protein
MHISDIVKLNKKDLIINEQNIKKNDNLKEEEINICN